MKTQINGKDLSQLIFKLLSIPYKAIFRILRLEKPRPVSTDIRKELLWKKIFKETYDSTQTDS